MINPDALAPLLEGDNATHFKAAGDGRLVVPHCRDCGHHWFPAAHICPQCLGENVDWAEVSGRATLWRSRWMKARSCMATWWRHWWATSRWACG
jgi:hypothetical protein